MCAGRAVSGKRLILLGAGHAHALALPAAAAAAAAAGWELVLVCGEKKVPYSGMMTGAMAGLYRQEEIYIDVPRLAKGVRVELVCEDAENLDADARTLRLTDGRKVDYDLLSLNVGGTIRAGFPCQPANCCPVKPAAGFFSWLEGLPANPARTVAVIGGGVAGAEVALALDARLRAAKRRGGVFVVGMQGQLAPGYPAFARALGRHMERRGISLLLGSAVVEVGADRVVLEDGTSAAISEAVIATGVRTWEGLSRSGLVVDEGGFVEINGMLQSISHPEVFAAGDCARLDLAAGALRKAGVYAVRQAPTLAANLAAAMNGGSLQKWKGGSEALAIVSNGQGSAIAHRNGRTVEGRWVWKWKDYLDRAFMRKVGGNAS